jgi:hypothetical protein
MVSGIGAMTVRLTNLAFLSGSRRSNTFVEVSAQRAELVRTQRDGIDLTEALRRLRDALDAKSRPGLSDHARATSSLNPALDPDVDPDELIDNVAVLSGVASGNFTVAGQLFTVNPATQSLNDVLSSINGAGLGVTASVTVGGQVELVASDALASFTVSDGTSGFLATLGISNGTYDRRANQDARLTEVMEEFARRFNKLYWGDAGTSSLSGLRNDLRALIEGAFDADGPRYGTSFGLTFRVESPTSARAEFDGRDQVLFRKALREDATRVTSFFLDEGTSGSALIDRLLGRISEATTDARARLGDRGLVVDLVA